MIKVLVLNAYVTVGGRLFHQTKGIPMGINPAVYMANYFLFRYEFAFLEQFLPLCGGIGPVPTPVRAAVESFLSTHSQDLTAVSNCVGVAPPSDLRAALARVVLDSFDHTARYVDDFTSGPNRFLHLLWYIMVLWYSHRRCLVVSSRAYTLTS